MNTIADKDFDYQAYMRENSPDSSKMNRGIESRKKRLEAAMDNASVRIDSETLRQFRQLAPGEAGHEGLINQILKEWLAVRDMKELFRAEIQAGVQQALAQFDWSSLKAQRRSAPIKKPGSAK